MNTLQIIFLAVMAFFAICLLATWAAGFVRRNRLITACNIAEGVHTNGVLSLLAAAPISTGLDDRVSLLGKFGADNQHVAVADAADLSIGWINDEAELAEDPVNLHLHGGSFGTKLAVASGAIALGDFVVGDDDGKVQTLPAGAGTYYIIGRALAAAAADEDIIEVDPLPAVQRVVT